MNSTYNPELHHRRSLRLRGHDYRQAGAYFLTICAYNRECLFGNIVDGLMELNQFGQIVAGCWQAVPQHRPNVEVDAFVVMPNHFHGIFVISPSSSTNNVETQLVVSASSNALALGNKDAPTPSLMPKAREFHRPLTGSLSVIVRSFKASVTKEINTARDAAGTPVWQTNYYEHIIRDEDDYDRIRTYIMNNPTSWDKDENNLTRERP